MTATTVWTGKFLSVIQDGAWEYAERPGGIGAAVIVAIDSDEDGDHLLLIEQHRIPAGRICLELPAGLIGDDGETETAAIAGARELEEETGYRAARIEELGTFYSSPGLTSEAFTVVHATALTRTGESEPAITVHRVALAEVPVFVTAKRQAGLGIDAKLLLFLGGQLI